MLYLANNVPINGAWRSLLCLVVNDRNRYKPPNVANISEWAGKFCIDLSIFIQAQIAV